MKLVKCPDACLIEPSRSLFLAGGISNCSDWQSTMISMIDGQGGTDDLVLINPRRDNFDVSDPKMTHDQITWEYVHLDIASAVSFWFLPETLCPITLYELGVSAAKGRRIYVGADPSYSRLIDLQIQLGLIRPDVTVITNLRDLVNSILADCQSGLL